MFRIDSAGVYRAQALEQFPWLEHGFGTRSSPTWPSGSGVATLRQVHSDRALLADQAGVIGEGDALISNQPGIWLAIRTADCLPILIADPVNRAVAAVHAGWRGIALEIVPKTIGAMADRFGSHPHDLLIAIGPGIGACCFEVGPEVAQKFAAIFPERQDLKGRTKIDLVETIWRQLGRNGGILGQHARQLATSRLCTACQPHLFHSYRRDREAAGRMLSAIRIL